MNGHRNHRRPSQAANPPARKRSIWDDLPVQVVPTENLPSFAELGLPPEIVAGLTKRGIAAPFPIQAATIPDAITGRDVLGRAATGSGKTLAFGLAMITRLDGGTRIPKRPRGLVLVPTRELAMQVADALGPAARDRGMRTMIVAGGLPIQKQINTLSDGVDIVVATPGRLVDLIDRRSCKLDNVEIVVLDEADHMADLGFLPVVKQLLNQTPADGQRLLFSATLDGDVASLVDLYLSNPAVHALSTVGASVDTMSHHVFRVEQDAKFDLIASIANRPGRSILFVRTKHGADRLAMQLSTSGVNAVAIHGNLTQNARKRALENFQSGNTRVLVATDVAARGIHVDDVDLVVHYDPPADHKDYLHRSGRTARAGARGTVVSLILSSEARDNQRMRERAGIEVSAQTVVPGHPVVRAIAESGEPIVVTAPARMPYSERPGRSSSRRTYSGPRATGSSGGSGDRPQRQAARPQSQRPRSTAKG
jgi:superfamily II DNA/RNA helicase